MAESLLIRADGGTAMGTGHLLRCLALAQAWGAAGGTAVFVLAQSVPAIEARLQQAGMQLHHLPAAIAAGSPDDAEATAVLGQQYQVHQLVVDGYQFGADYQKQLKAAGFRLLVLDDYGHANHYYADLVLNQNSSATVGLYPAREPSTRLLLGTRYTLLRQEFLPWRQWVRPSTAVAHNILVTLGGSDPDNVTLQVIHALQQLPPALSVAVRVLVGGQNPHYLALATAVASTPHIQLLQNVSDMPAQMAWADVAISASGSSCWELAFMGVPALLIVLAENQLPLANKVAAQTGMVNLGWFYSMTSQQIMGELQALLLDSGRRQQISQRARELVDGLGAERVLAVLQANQPLRARLANVEDKERLFIWANDPLTRQMSFNTEPISWQAHGRWFTAMLERPQTAFLIVEWFSGEQWVPIAQVRVDETGTLSVGLDPAYRGRRLGTAVLLTAIAYLPMAVGWPALTAYIRPENKASQKIFTQAGFVYAGQQLVDGQSVLTYTYPFVKLPEAIL